MAANTHLSIASWNLALNAALDAALNGGFIEIYTGAQPATPDAATTGTKLAKLSLNATAFGAASGGTKTANAITSSAALASGTAGYFRAFKADDSTAVIDGSIGTSGTDMIIGSTTITAGDTIAISSWTVSMPVGQ